MLLKREVVALELDGAVVRLVCIDDLHYFQVGNFDEAA
jgi:hypothetical protein